MKKKIVYLTLTILIVLCSCSPPKGIQNEEVYRPDILDDGKPEISGNYIELSKSKDLNLHQLCLRETLYYGVAPLNNPNLAIEGLGITNLNLLKSIEGDSEYASFYSTRLNNLDGLKGFKKLKHLSIRGSDMEDFSILEELPMLQTLDISYSLAKDLSTLAKCNSLQNLTLDEESNFSLNPINHLMEDHLNNEGKVIALKIKYIKGKLKNYRILAGQPMLGKITPTLEGVFNIHSAGFYKYDRADYFVYKKGENVGKLILSENTFTFILNDTGEFNLSFSKKGTYSTVGNLIFFKTDDGVEFINSYYWSSQSLLMYINDRESFPQYDLLIYSAYKISNDPNYIEN